MNVIDSYSVVVYTSDELKEVLEGNNLYEYIYFGDNITLDSGIVINENKSRVTICGTYMGNRYTYTGIISSESVDTICVNATNKDIRVVDIDIVSSNIYGVINVPVLRSCADVLVSYSNVTFNGTRLSFNPYGNTKIVDSVITIEDTNGISGQEVCNSCHVIIGGATTISSNANSPLFYFKTDNADPYVIFLCKSDVKLSTTNREFMSGTAWLNFTILHDTNVLLVTGNGFAPNPVYGVNNVLIDERATFVFIENSHQRVPMWSIFGSFSVKSGANVELINSYANTPIDNYNIYFKGQNCKMVLDNPNSLVIYSKNANVLYTDNDLDFVIRCSRLNMWSDSMPLSSAGDIYNRPDYYWYKEDDLLSISGVITSTSTSITSHNLTDVELGKLSSLQDFVFQSRKQFSIGNMPINVHSVNKNKNTISGHTAEMSSVLIKYNDVIAMVDTDSDCMFSYDLTSSIDDDTEIEIISNVAGSFVYGRRIIKAPYDGELSMLKATTMVGFSLVPISYNPVILPKDRSFDVMIVDSRINSSAWSFYAYIDKPLTSYSGYLLEDALVFKRLDDRVLVLSDVPVLVYSGSDNQGNVLLSNITWSKEKGPLLDLSNNALEVNEEYFADIKFILEE